MNRRIVLILLALAATIAAAHAQKMTETYHQDSLLIDVETQEVVPASGAATGTSISLPHSRSSFPPTHWDCWRRCSSTACK